LNIYVVCVGLMGKRRGINCMGTCQEHCAQCSG